LTSRIETVFNRTIVIAEPQTNSIHPLLAPSSIAVIGASDDSGRVGGMPLHFLAEVGYAGAVYPVNPRRATVQGRESYARIGDVPGPVDLAIVAVAADQAVEVVAECADAGVRGAVIFSAGFAETDSAGQARQDELARIASETGIRLCGPNCAGIMNVAQRMTASFGSHLAADTSLIPGPIAIVSQSGAVGAYLFTLARRAGIGLSYWVTTGNEVDTTVADYVRVIAEDDGTSVIALYLEQVRDAKALMEAAEIARVNGKALVGVLAGRSKAAERALRSHTAAMAGDRTVAAAALDELGVIRVDSIEALLTTSVGLAGERRPRGNGVGIVTISGAAGIMMLDRASELGLHVPALSEAAQARIKALLPYASTENPVDITGNISNTPEIFAPVLEELLRADSVGAVVCFLGHVLLSPHVGERLLRELADSAAGTTKPVWLVGVVAEPAHAAVLEAAGIPLFTDPVTAVAALGAVHRANAWSEARGADILARRRAADDLIPAPAPDQAELTEAQAQAWLAPLGVRFPRQVEVTDPAGAAAAADELGGLVAMKVLSPDIAHKSDVGGVRTGVTVAGAVVAYEDILRAVRERAPAARVDGVLVQQQVEGHPVIVGTKDDETFGPVVLVGTGGIYTEITGDRAVGLAPVDKAGAEALIERTKLPEILRGARGRPALAYGDLVDLIVAMSQLAWSARGEIQSMELNPVLVGPDEAVAVDAFIETKGVAHGA
jgi:acyl-CoA synthetase (NDP forming)